MDRNTESTSSTTVCDACRRIPISHLALDVDEPIGGWLRFFEERNVQVFDDAIGRPSIPRYVLGDVIDEQREREARLAEEAAAQQAPVVTPRGIPAREDLSAYEVMMAAGGISPQQEFGRIPPPRFLEEALEEGSRHQAAEREAVRRRKEKAKMRTVSTKETAELTNRCDRCRLWFAYTYLAGDGRWLCRLCLELTGLNRARRAGERNFRPIAPW